MVNPTIEMFITALNAGINAWEAAGKILVALRAEEDDVFKRIHKDHPFVTQDMLEVFWNFGMRTLYPMVPLLPRTCQKFMREMPYEVQQRICAEPVQIVTRIVGDKPVVLRKPVTQLTAEECGRALWRNGNYTVEHQIKQMQNPPVKTIQELLPQPKTVVEERKPREVARFAVSRGTAGTWRFENTMANPFNTQNVRLEQGQCVIVLQEYGKDQE
jgi:hypothetical protein